MQRRAIATIWPESISRTSGSPLLATPRSLVVRGQLPQWDACSRRRYSGARLPGAGASSGTNYSTGRRREAHGVSPRRRRGSGGQSRPEPTFPAGSRPPSTTIGFPDPGRRLSAGRSSPTSLPSLLTEEVHLFLDSSCPDATKPVAIELAATRDWLDPSLPLSLIH